MKGTGIRVMTTSLAAYVTKITNGIAVFLLVIMTALVTLEVFFRYVLLRSLFLTDELARFLFVWVGFLGSSLAQRAGAHISMEFVQNRLGGVMARRLRAASLLLVLVFLVVVLVASIRLLPSQLEQRTATLRVSMFWVYLAVPVGVLLMILQVFATLAGAKPVAAERPEFDL